MVGEESAQGIAHPGMKLTPTRKSLGCFIAPYIENPAGHKGSTLSRRDPATPIANSIAGTFFEKKIYNKKF